MNDVKLKNSILLLLAAIIWGIAFVAQSVSMDYVGVFTFNCVRNIIGGIFLIPCIIILGSIRHRELNEKEKFSVKKTLHVTKIELIGGCMCGIALFFASNFQQAGIVYTTVGKAGFITALYVVIVPLLGLIFKKKVSPIVWISVILSVFGLYLLCMTKDSLSLSFGDLLVLVCALLFSIHILVIDYYSPKCDGVMISCIQFIMAGLLSGICMFLFESPSISDIFAAKIPILYAGIMSSGVAYTFQIIGQKNMNPTVASLILCLESVVSALAGWAILHESLSYREITGCIFMFSAIVLAQLPIGKQNK